ncbi:MAG: cytochrome c oxidase accessory protein CcoG [Weeksellaceae bacterium]|jgi:cytochrome c oxidase accessory protein FixG|nr:cytochrome c oxidase accessory protein CcoG [Weeksellaceae bacterium]
MSQSQISDKDLAQIFKEDEEFRNLVGTMDRKGKRKWMFPKKPSGKFTNYRTYVSWFLLIILVVLPFIKLPNGNPAFLFNIPKGEFVIGGYPFFTSDFFLLAVGMITTILFIVLFTVVYGRIFCGWICPQTIFMEHVFRKIEYWIEGDRPKQIKLAKQKWDSEKIQKRLLKWVVFSLISLFFGTIFFGYIIGSDDLIQLIKEGPIKNSGTFIGVLIFSASFYFIFAWFREQVCTLVCPYGRLQSVLVDKKTIMVSYDYVRGEGTAGRSKFKKGEDRNAVGKGDCIDCNQCVVVCPTGIDIRNGAQLECIGCTACIDACDEVMLKVGFPTGLIRYASEENIQEGKKFKFTGRMLAYTLVLVSMLLAISAFLFSRKDVELKFLHVPGRNYTIVDNAVTNLYQYTLYNKTNQDLTINFVLESHKNGKITSVQGTIPVKLIKGSVQQGVVEVSIPVEGIKSYKEKIVLKALDQQGKELDDYATSFSAPH